MGSKFYVRPVWDDKNKVYCSDSNIIGLHLEAETIKEFEEIVSDVAYELILCNHYSDRTTAKDLIDEFKMPPAGEMAATR